MQMGQWCCYHIHDNGMTGHLILLPYPFPSVYLPDRWIGLTTGAEYTRKENSERRQHHRLHKAHLNKINDIEPSVLVCRPFTGVCPHRKGNRIAHFAMLMEASNNDYLFYIDLALGETRRSLHRAGNRCYSAVWYSRKSSLHVGSWSFITRQITVVKLPTKILY